MDVVLYSLYRSEIRKMLIHTMKLADHRSRSRFDPVDHQVDAVGNQYRRHPRALTHLRRLRESETNRRPPSTARRARP